MNVSLHLVSNTVAVREVPSVNLKLENKRMGLLSDLSSNNPRISPLIYVFIYFAHVYHCHAVIFLHCTFQRYSPKNVFH